MGPQIPESAGQFEGAGGGGLWGGVGGDGVEVMELHAGHDPAVLHASKVLCRPLQSPRDRRLPTLKAEAERQ